VQNVVVSGNGNGGIRIEGRNVTNARISDSVAIANDAAGIAIEASGDLVGTRVERCTARDNGFSLSAFREPGITVRAEGDVNGTVITDSVALRNGTIGIHVGAGGRLAKTKLTNVTAIANESFGILASAHAEATATSIANAYAATNKADGVIVDADVLTATTTKSVVSRENGGQGLQLGASHLLDGAKITDTQAIGNGRDG